jgi:hypothetical protein
MSAAILTTTDRQRLASILGMLGSNAIGERDNAARAAEQFRRQHGLTWADLLLIPEPPAPQAPQPPPPEPVWTAPQQEPEPPAPAPQRRFRIWLYADDPWVAASLAFTAAATFLFFYYFHA